MTKEEIYHYLKEKNIWYEITEHEAVYNMEEAKQINIPYPEAEAKNLFVRDDKKRNYYLLCIKGDKKVDLKNFKNDYHTRHLSFASETELMEILHLYPGSVTPFGLLNSKIIKVHFFLDQDFMKDSQLIGVHPNDNTATVWLYVKDLLEIIKEYAEQISIVEF